MVRIHRRRSKKSSKTLYIGLAIALLVLFFMFGGCRSHNLINDSNVIDKSDHSNVQKNVQSNDIDDGFQEQAEKNTQQQANIKDVITIGNETDCKIVSEKRKIVMSEPKEFEITVLENITTAPDFSVNATRSGKYYVNWNSDDFSAFISDVKFDGWSSPSRIAQFLSNNDVKALQIYNLCDAKAKFTVTRYFMGNADKSLTKVIDPGKSADFEFKSVSCLFIKQGVVDINDYISFIKTYDLGKDDAIVFNKDGIGWGCIRAKYEVVAHDVTKTIKTKKTVVRIINQTKEEVYNRLECGLIRQ